MAALGDPLRRELGAVDRGEVLPDSDRQEGSHNKRGPCKPNNTGRWPRASRVADLSQNGLSQNGLNI